MSVSIATVFICSKRKNNQWGKTSTKKNALLILPNKLFTQYFYSVVWGARRARRPDTGDFFFGAKQQLGELYFLLYPNRV